MGILRYEKIILDNINIKVTQFTNEHQNVAK